jgi:hypothetical protein
MDEYFYEWGYGMGYINYVFLEGNGHGDGRMGNGQGDGDGGVAMYTYPLGDNIRVSNNG